MRGSKPGMVRTKQENVGAAPCGRPQVGDSTLRDGQPRRVAPTIRNHFEVNLIGKGLGKDFQPSKSPGCGRMVSGFRPAGFSPES